MLRGGAPRCLDQRVPSSSLGRPIFSCPCGTRVRWRFFVPPLVAGGLPQCPQCQCKNPEADFRNAIALARTMQAKAWELRATTDLARLLRAWSLADVEDTSWLPSVRRALQLSMWQWVPGDMDDL